MAKSFHNTYQIALCSYGFKKYCENLYESPYLQFNLLSSNQRHKLLKIVNEDILDFGCGLGGLCQELIHNGFNVLGYDIFDNLEFSFPYQNSFPKNKSFKTVIAIDSFYNLPNYQKILLKISKIAPMGKLIIAMTFQEQEHKLLDAINCLKLQCDKIDMTEDDDVFWQKNEEFLHLIDDSPQIYKIKKNEIESFRKLRKKSRYRRLLLNIKFT